MSEYEGFDDVIGRASDLMPDDYVPLPPPHKEIVAPVASLEELERPSPKPFIGRPDLDFPDLDSGEPLYIPRFLVRKWGPAKFERSGYRALWQQEADRGRQPFRQDLKPERKKR